MRIVDAQVHIWSGGTPSGHHRKVSSFTAEELLAEMDAAGVDAAVIHPPVSWDPGSNGLAIEKWESPEALKAHAAAPHMKAYAAKTKEMIASRVIHVLSPAG